MENKEDKPKPDKETLLVEYQQLMESQRDNTRIAYSWISTILLVLCSGLFFFGLTTNPLSSFIPAMVLGVLLCLIWAGLTEVFARYIRQRFDRLNEISIQLGISRMPFSPTKWWLPLTQARTYVWLFVFVYIFSWILRLFLGFIS
ncbi:hypothetical protein ACFLTT_01305 [Chloroflexota bacterium]